MNDVRVVVADDQATVRDALAAMLDLAPGITVVGAAADGVARAAAAGRKPNDRNSGRQRDGEQFAFHLGCAFLGDSRRLASTQHTL